MPEQVSATALLPVLTFSLGPQHYALLIDDVLEVASMVEIMTIKDSRPEVLGVVNRRGDVLPLLDLRLVFGQPAEPIGLSTLFIVALHQQQQFGLVVDEIHQVEYVPSASLRDASTSGKLIRGIISYKEQLIQVISPAALWSAYLSGEAEA